MFRISLRQLFILVAFIAMAIVSLHHASPMCQALVGLLVLLAIFAAVIAGIFDRGPRRAFAVGFALVSLGYALLVPTGEKVSVAYGYFQNSSVELVAADGWPPRLPTTLFLRQIYRSVQRTAWIDVSTGKDVPGYDWTKYQADHAAKSATGGFLPIQPKYSPPSEIFMPTGHYWWTLLLGFLGGDFARFVDVRRMKEQPAQPKVG